MFVGLVGPLFLSTFCANNGVCFYYVCFCRLFLSLFSLEAPLRFNKLHSEHQHELLQAVPPPLEVPKISCFSSLGEAKSVRLWIDCGEENHRDR